MPQTLVLAIPLALAAAALFGAQAVAGRRGLNYLDPQTGAMITIGTAAAVFWLMAPLAMEASFWRSPALLIFALNGMLHPTTSMWLAFEANRHLGPTLSSTISATTPMFATAGAVLTLGEGLTLAVLAGTLGIVAGVIVLSWSRAGLRSWALPVLAFPLGAALVRAFTFVWGKYGLLRLDEPHFAATVSFSVAFLISISVFNWRRLRGPVPVPLPGAVWCVLGGLCISGAILLMYSALSRGTVVVVSPLINTYPMFTLAIVLAFRQEIIGRRILVGVAMVMAGVVLVSAS